MSVVSNRLRARIKRDFGDPGSASEVEHLVREASESERVQAAIVFASRGDMRAVHRGAALARVDWRDVLVNGGLANEDWVAVLERELGP